MKKLALSLFVLVPMAPISAVASLPATTTLPMLAPSAAPAVGNIPGNPVLVGSCATRLDTMVAELQAGKTIAGVDTTLLIGRQALAESPSLPVGNGFSDVGGDAHRSGSTITGTSHVAAPGANSRANVTFTISKVDGKARLTWAYGGKSYGAVVDSCHHDYWTATAATSAIAIKVGDRQSPPE